MDIESILNIIKNLPLKEALTFLGTEKIFDLSQKGYEKIRRIIQEKGSIKKYGFVPNKEESNYLRRISNKQYYQDFLRLLPKNDYADFIRTGYLIAYLNKKGGNSNRSRVREIFDFIHNQPNGAHNIKIVHVITTGAIVPILDYLDELKKSNFDYNYIKNVFEEIIRSWDKYTYFVKSDETVGQIISIIKRKLQDKQNLFMIFSYGSAKQNTTKSVAYLLNNGYTEGYFYESKNNIEGDLEVHSSSFSLLKERIKTEDLLLQNFS